MTRLGLLISGLALLATFDIVEGVCMSCSDKCKDLDGEETRAKFKINPNGASVDCVCIVGNTREEISSGCTGTMQADGRRVEFCCSSCAVGDICTTSTDGDSAVEEMSESTCTNSDDCPTSSDPECGYDCMAEGKCGMWCNGAEQPQPPASMSCVTDKDCASNERCHCEAHGKVRRRLLFAKGVTQECSCRV